MSIIKPTMAEIVNFSGALKDIPLYKGLIGRYAFAEGGGTTIYDTSGYSRNGTLTGGATWGTGNRGSVVNLNGSSGHVDVGISSDFSFERTDSFSVSCWFRLTTVTSAIQILFGKNQSTSPFSGWYLAAFLRPSVNSTSLTFFMSGTSGVNYLEVDIGATQIAANTLYHAGFSYDGTSLASGVEIYRNGLAGTKVIRTNLLATSTITTSRPLIGARNSAAPESFVSGFVDNVKIWPRTLTPNEMLRDFLNPYPENALYRKVSYFFLPTGITFDSASNSGDQAASANYTFSRTVSESSPYLSVNVELLTVTSATVVSVTDDDGAGDVPLTLLGAISTVTGAGRVECWGLANPVAGTKNIRVILSASIESVATAQVHGNVHQTVPVEGFNSAQATNVGVANDASVTITSIADNCWVVAAVVANDTAIGAGQTVRNNVSGTLGSGLDEDSGGPVTPAGATVMTATGMGATTTWAIAGYALRPLAASGGRMAKNTRSFPLGVYAGIHRRASLLNQ